MRFLPFLAALTLQAHLGAYALEHSPLDSLDSIFGKNEKQVIQIWGQPNLKEDETGSSTLLMYPMPGEPFPAPSVPTGAPRVDFRLTNGAVTGATFFVESLVPSQKDFPNSVARTLRTGAAVATNLVSEKLASPKQSVKINSHDILVKGKDDTERWSTVKENLLHLRGLNEPQVKAIFGEGQLQESPRETRKDYYSFARTYQLTVPKAAGDPREQVAVWMNVWFFRGTVWFVSFSKY